MSRKLLLFWQNPQSREWFTVGLLEYVKGKYLFSYSKSARDLYLAGDFVPFGVMQDFDKIYTSETLFPLFKNRLLDKSRPEYGEYLSWLGLSPDTATDMDELSRSGGVRATDQLQILPYPERSFSGGYQVDFFVHGLRHINKKGAERVALLKEGEELLLVKEDDNEFDSLALAVSTESPPVIIGYCPRFFVKDFRKLLDADEGRNGIKLMVSNINMDAPLQFRLRCTLSAVWFDGFVTFADEFGAQPSPELLRVAN